MVEELDLTDQAVSTIADIIDSEIRSHIPDWESKRVSEDFAREATTSDGGVSQTKDGMSPFSNEFISSPESVTNIISSPASLTLERTLSGRKYWSDSPKGGGGHSPIKIGSMKMSPRVNTIIAENSEAVSGEPTHESPLSQLNSNTDSVSNIDSTTGEDETTGLDSACLDAVNAAIANIHLGNESHLCEEGSKLLTNIDPDEIKGIPEELRDLLVKQKKELDEMKMRHEAAISDLLKKLSPDVRQRVLSICNLKLRDVLKPTFS